jgi:hypothetical protein
MSEHAPFDDEAETAELPASEASRESVEVYEADGGTVLYDAENPLAWLKSSRALTLPDQV